MKTIHLLGFDFGASSGRAMLGTLENGRLTLSELHRFSNDPVKLGERFVWDVPRLFFEMKAALAKAAREGIAPDAIGIDTWGVDYGLLDGQGNLISIPVHYRDARTEGMMEKAFCTMPKAEIFRHTGLAFNSFNTLFQLLAAKEAGELSGSAKTLLFMPDLLAYFLTGEKKTEYTIASTSQLINPATRTWDRELLSAFGLPAGLLTDIEPAGTVRGTLLDEIAQEAGLPAGIPVIATASHDTAAAVASVPAKEGERFAYLSSGTWSLLGAETAAPLCTPQVMEANYTNEGGVCGTTRLLKNIMGLWIIQECKREWDRRGQEVSFGELVTLAQQAPAFKAVIDVDDPCFLAPGGMPERVRDYCRRTGQAVPEGMGEIARVVYEGLALKYRWAIERLEKDLLGHRIDVLHIVGGGSKNELLNRFTAEAIGRRVVAGPSEGTVIGNLLVQAMALGGIGSLAGLRRVVAASFDNTEYLPGEGGAWDKPYERLLRLGERA